MSDGATILRRVLLTRPAEGTAETARAVAGRGFDPVSAPMLAIAPRPILRLDAAGPQAVLVTSGHALAALDPIASRADLPLLAVGDATAARARAHGWRDVESASGDAASLAALAAHRLVPGRGPLLLASGAGQGLGLAAALRARGFRVIRRVAYAQMSAGVFPAAAAAALASGVHATLFLSRSAALAFARLLPPGLARALGASLALAISADALAPVGRLPWRALRVAVRPTQEDVLALL